MDDGYTVSGFVQSGQGTDVADAYDASLTYVFDTGDCLSQTVFGITVTLPVRPTNVGDVLLCSPIFFGQSPPKEMGNCGTAILFQPKPI